MLTLRWRERMDSFVRGFGLLILTGWTLMGQEGSGVGWGPHETGELDLNWKTLLVGFLLALACCGLWKLLMWLLERNRAAVNWNKARLWWPTAMLVWGLAMLALLARGASGSALEAVFFVFGVLNFPVLVTILVLLGFVDQAIQPAIWLKILASSLMLWSGNYFLVRLAEWRAWKNEPVSLHLANAPSVDAKD